MRAAIYAACYAGVKERCRGQQADSAQKQEFCNPFRAIAGNRPLFICASPTFAPFAFIKLAIQAYYTQYVLERSDSLSIWDFFSMGCIFIGVF